MRAGELARVLRPNRPGNGPRPRHGGSGAGQREQSGRVGLYAGFCTGSPHGSPVAVIYLGLPLPAASSGLPAGSDGQPSNACAAPGRGGRKPSDLAPGGVYLAARVTSDAGALLPHRFTLTSAWRRWRSVFCGTVPRVTPGGCYPPPCPAEPGRSSAVPACRTPIPTRPPGQLVRSANHRAPPEGCPAPRPAARGVGAGPPTNRSSRLPVIDIPGEGGEPRATRGRRVRATFL